MKSNLSRAFVFVLVLLASAAGNAWHGDGGYYHGGGWGGPAVVIDVPLGGYYSPNYYAPVCETVQVCNQYNHCWLQQECN